MELTGLREVEHYLIQYLLNGLSDENAEISQSCLKFLNEHGARMKEALTMLGEEETEAADEEMKQE